MAALHTYTFTRYDDIYIYIKYSFINFKLWDHFTACNAVKCTALPYIRVQWAF